MELLVKFEPLPAVIISPLGSKTKIPLLKILVIPGVWSMLYKKKDLNLILPNFFDGGYIFEN